MKIIPLADRVVIKTVEVEETTKGGLILTGSAKEKPQVAQVVAVGPGGVVDGKEVKMTVKVGDKVLRHRGQGGRRRMHHRASGRHSGHRGVSVFPSHWIIKLLRRSDKIWLSRSSRARKPARHCVPVSTLWQILLRSPSAPRAATWC